MTNSPFDAAYANGANSGAERNVGKSQSGSGGVDADHIGIVFLVGGEDQRDDLGLIAEAIGEQAGGWGDRSGGR